MSRDGSRVYSFKYPTPGNSLNYTQRKDNDNAIITNKIFDVSYSHNVNISSDQSGNMYVFQGVIPFNDGTQMEIRRTAPTGIDQNDVLVDVDLIGFGGTNPYFGKHAFMCDKKKRLRF